MVSVKKALLLDEVDEHHAVQHQRCVPVPISLGGNAVDEVAECGQFLPEAFVEAPGHLLYIQGLTDFGSNCRDSKPCFFV